jgi:hypothetical protein
VVQILEEAQEINFQQARREYNAAERTGNQMETENKTKKWLKIVCSKFGV